jgi:hypothetical protein
MRMKAVAWQQPSSCRAPVFQAGGAVDAEVAHGASVGKRPPLKVHLHQVQQLHDPTSQCQVINVSEIESKQHQTIGCKEQLMTGFSCSSTT